MKHNLLGWFICFIIKYKILISKILIILRGLGILLLLIVIVSLVTNQFIFSEWFYLLILGAILDIIGFIGLNLIDKIYY